MSQNKKIAWNEVFSFKSLAFTFLGSLCAVIAIKGFMIPNQFLDGGITGISILLHEIFHIDITYPLILLNIPFVIWGYSKLGKEFAVQSILAIIFLVILINVVNIPAITQDNILIAMFGGLFMGLGIGFVIRAGGVIDGLEVIADYADKKMAISTPEIIMFINTGIFLIAAFSFGIEKAMYSILTYFTALQVSKYVVDGFEEYTTMHIISSKSDEIKSLIVQKFGKAITVYKGERGYLPGSFDVKEDCDIIVTVITRLEIHKMKLSISEIDPKAFVYIQNIRELGGGIVKKIRRH